MEGMSSFWRSLHFVVKKYTLLSEKAKRYKSYNMDFFFLCF